MNNKKIQLTQKGLNDLQAELEDLKNVKRPKIVARLANARSQGDLSENSDYQNARDELEFLDGRIDELEHVVKHAQVSTGGNGIGVSVGNSVKVKVNGTETVFEIVGEWEADPMQKKISHESPLGQALSGRVVGDRVEVEAPAGKLTYEILSVD